MTIEDIAEVGEWLIFHVAAESVAALGVDPNGFAELVAARIETLREYDAHEATVRAHAANDGMKSEDRWVTLAVPPAPAAVGFAIRATNHPDGSHTYVPNYIIDAEPLDKRKAALTEQVNEAERNAIHAVLPQRKARAHQLREFDIRKEDAARANAEIEKQPHPRPPFDVEKFNRINRPAADTEFLDAHAAREATLQKIYRWAANLHSEIEDLTEETVDAFEVNPFNG